MDEVIKITFNFNAPCNFYSKNELNVKQCYFSSAILCLREELLRFSPDLRFEFRSSVRFDLLPLSSSFRLLESFEISSPSLV